MTAPDREREARERLEGVVTFAYEHGYHEHGVPIVDAYAQAVRDTRDAEVLAMVTELRKRRGGRFKSADAAWNAALAALAERMGT